MGGGGSDITVRNVQSRYLTVVTVWSCLEELQHTMLAKVNPFFVLHRTGPRGRHVFSFVGEGEWHGGGGGSCKVL